MEGGGEGSRGREHGWVLQGDGIWLMLPLSVHSPKASLPPSHPFPPTHSTRTLTRQHGSVDLANAAAGQRELVKGIKEVVGGEPKRFADGGGSESRPVRGGLRQEEGQQQDGR